VRSGGLGFKASLANSSQDSISKITKANMDWRYGLSGRVPALQAQSPKPLVQTPVHQMKKKPRSEKYNELNEKGNREPTTELSGRKNL
jgi:hypothetical protein